MSTLKVNTVQHNTSGFNNVVQFTDGGGTENGTLCRAWVNFNGTGTVAIRADFNVNSITDNTTGDYTVNFTAAMVDANYSTQLTGDSSGTRNNTYGRIDDDAAAPTASALRVQYADDQNTAVNPTYASVAIFR